MHFFHTFSILVCLHSATAHPSLYATQTISTSPITDCASLTLSDSYYRQTLISTCFLDSTTSVSYIFPDFDVSSPHRPEYYVVQSGAGSIAPVIYKFEDVECDPLVLNYTTTMLRTLCQTFMDTSEIVSVMETVPWIGFFQSLSESHEVSPGVSLEAQRHFPDDFKKHIDGKRWLHAVSLLVVMKDLWEHS